MAKVKQIDPVFTGEELMTEEWCNLESLGYKKYEISNLGRLRYIGKPKILKGSKAKGYYRAKLYDGTGNYEDKAIHILVLKAFNPDIIDEEFIVDHINENKLDNRLVNLRKSTDSENQKAVSRSGTKKERARPIFIIDIKYNITFSFDSIDDAAISNPYNLRKEEIVSIIEDTIESDEVEIVYQGVEDRRVPIPEDCVEIKSNPGYGITPDGCVYNLKRSMKKILQPDRDGYYTVTMSRKHDQYTCSVHRLVAKTFIPNDDPIVKNYVNHKDGNKTNNHVDNLEWTTNRDNIIHGNTINLRSDQRTVFVYDYYFNFLSAEVSPAEVMKKYKIKDRGSMQNVLSGKKKSVNGYRVSYVYLEDPRKVLETKPDTIWKRCPHSDEHDISNYGDVFTWHTLTLVKGKGRGWYKFVKGEVVTKLHIDKLVKDLFVKFE